MATNDGSIPDIVVTKIIERDGVLVHGSQYRSWSLELYPDPGHSLSKYLGGKALNTTFTLDISIYTTENVRYMKALQTAEKLWTEYWMILIQDLDKDNFILGGSL